MLSLNAGGIKPNITRRTSAGKLLMAGHPKCAYVPSGLNHHEQSLCAVSSGRHFRLRPGAAIPGPGRSRGEGNSRAKRSPDHPHPDPAAYLGAIHTQPRSHPGPYRHPCRIRHGVPNLNAFTDSTAERTSGFLRDRRPAGFYDRLVGSYNCPRLGNSVREPSG